MLADCSDPFYVPSWLDVAVLRRGNRHRFWGLLSVIPGLVGTPCPSALDRRRNVALIKLGGIQCRHCHLGGVFCAAPPEDGDSRSEFAHSGDLAVERSAEQVSQRMIATIVIGCTAAVLLILVWYLLRASTAGIDPLQEWRSQSHEVSVDAFRLLVDSGEAVFLWESVSRIQFRRLQRKRIALALQCARAMSGNASILMRVATHARR